MIVAHYKFPRGSQINIPLDFSSDDGEAMSAIGSLSAWLRFSGDRPSEITAGMPKVATFTVEPRDHDAGWFLRLSSAVSNSLTPGFHVTDIHYTTPDGIDEISSRFALVEITLPVTGGA